MVTVSFKLITATIKRIVIGILKPSNGLNLAGSQTATTLLVMATSMDNHLNDDKNQPIKIIFEFYILRLISELEIFIGIC